MKGNEAKQWIIPIGVGVGGWLGWKYVLKPLLESVGLKRDEEEEKADKNVEKTENLSFKEDYWNPNYYKQVVRNADTVQLLTSARYNMYIKQLWDATSWHNDDEEAIYGVFRAIKYKSQISQLAEQFFLQKGQDLYGYLKNYLNATELNTVLTITNKLQKGWFTKNGTPL